MTEKIKILLLNTHYSLQTFLSDDTFEFITMSLNEKSADIKNVDIVLINGYRHNMNGSEIADDMTVFKVAESIKQICPDLPMICVSDLDIPGQYKQYFIAHFENSINLGNLLSTIHEYVIK